MRHRSAALLAAAIGALALPAAAAAQTGPGVSYLIPAGNPFASTPGAAPEVWAYGLRNPFRFSVHPGTGALVIGDVSSSGADAREEVDLTSPAGGQNFGWPCREGSLERDCPVQGFTDPVFEYPRLSGGAIIGGYVVRDQSLAGLVGRYLYADLAAGDIQSISLNPGAPDLQSTGADVGIPGSFGEDALGRLYATAVFGGGAVFRLDSTGPGTLTPVSVGNFSAPVYVTAPPGDASRLFVVEQGGVVKVIRDGQPLEAAFLDLSHLTDAAGERGLMSIAFAPDYAQSGRLYVFYTEAEGGDVRVDEFRRSSDPDRADPGSGRVVLEIEHSGADNHNGGQLQFGHDGFLYVSVGDGGNEGEPNSDDDAQNLGSPLGKILRIDPDMTPGGGNPADTDPPGLRASARKRQRVLRLRGAVARGSCDERCGLSLSGRLRIGRRSFKLRTARANAAASTRRVRLKARLTRRSTRALRRALRKGRRPRVRLSLRATDLAGNRSPLARRTVRVRR